MTRALETNTRPPESGAPTVSEVRDVGAILQSTRDKLAGNGRLNSEIPKELESFLGKEWEFADGTRGVVVSGGPGTGTTTQIDALATILNIPEDSIFKAGEERKVQYKKKTGQPMKGGYSREKSADIATDRKSAKKMRRATPQNPALIDAQAGIAIAKWLEDRSPDKQLKMFKVLLTVDPQEGGKRVMDRENRKAEREGITRSETLDDWVAFNDERHQKDLDSWQDAHPRLKGKDPQDPSARDKDGREFYDLRIDTTNISEYQVAAAIIFNMWERGIIKPIEHQLTANQEFSLAQPSKKGGGKKAN